MRRKGTPFGLEVLKIIVLLSIMVLFGLRVLQSDRMEARFIAVENKLSRLEERMSEQVVVRPQATKAVPREARKWLHPEVPNFLEPDPYVMVPDDAVMGGAITRWYGPDPKGLNPLTESAADLREYVQSYVNDYLADYHYMNPDKYKPELAERIEVTDDYKEYIIYLRKGVMWHKPAVDWSNPKYDWLKGDHEFTARDVKFTMDLILNPQVECAHLRNYYKDLEECKVIDDYTLVFRWKKKTYNSIDFTLTLMPIPRFLYAFSEDGEPFPEASLGLRFNEHWYGQKAIGTGPYRFVSKEQGVSIKMTRNNDYWGPKPPIKDITWLIYPDPKTNLLKLKSGELDYGRLFPSDYREEILNAKDDSPLKTGKMQYAPYDQIVYYYIGWNLESPLFSDKRVRRGLTHCLDRETIVKNIFLGLGHVTSGPLYYHSPYYDKRIKPLPYDLEAARKLFAEAGWKDTDGDGILDRMIDGRKRDFEFTFLLYAKSTEWNAMATCYKEALYKVGIKLHITPVEWSLMQKRMDDHEFDCYSGGWGMVWNPDPYQIWHSSQADEPKSSNRIGFRSSEADAIIEELRETFDREKRIALCHRFHRLIYEEQPYTFFYSRRRVVAWWNHVQNTTLRPVRPQTFSLPWHLTERPR